MLVRTGMLLAVVFSIAACGGDKRPATDTAAPAATSDQSAPEASAPAAAAAGGSGAEKYAQICASCHQATGTGLEGSFPPLAGSDWVTGAPEVPIAIVLHGLQGEIEVKGQKYNGVMAAWGGSMSDADIAAVLTHERSSWGNSAVPVKEADVKAARAKYASRTTPWTAVELAPMRR